MLAGDLSACKDLKELRQRVAAHHVGLAFVVEGVEDVRLFALGELDRVRSLLRIEGCYAAYGYHEVHLGAHDGKVGLRPVHLSGLLKLGQYQERKKEG